MRLNDRRVKVCLGSLFLICLILLFYPTDAQKAQTNASPFSQNSDLNLNESDYVPNRVIVKLKGGIDINEAEIQSIFSDLRVESYNKVFTGAEPPSPQELQRGFFDLSNVWFLDLSGENRDVPAIARNLSVLPFVEYAEPDYIAEFTMTPDDPFWGITSTWDPEINYLWALEIIQAEQAWDITTGDASVIMAVLDRGVDYEHKDLKHNMWINSLEDLVNPGFFDPEPFPAGDINNFDEDVNGYDDDVVGYNFYGAGASRPEDVNGHGTVIAGIAGARGNNGLGIPGVCWNCKIMSLNSFDFNDSMCQIPFQHGDCGETSCWYPASGYLANGINYAANKEADVINMSFLFPAPPETFRQAMINAHNSGVTFVAAAGNDNQDIDLFNVTPARWPRVISVGGSDQFDNRWKGYWGANFGSSLDVVAPAGGPHGPEAPAAHDTAKNILSNLSEQSRYEVCGSGPLLIVPEPGCEPEEDCASRNTRKWGTSFAAPYVTGLVGLIKSAHTGFTNEHIRQIIRKSADDLLDPEDTGDNLPGFDVYSGYGRINAYQALLLSNSIIPMESLITSPMPREVVKGTIDIQGIARANPTNPTLNFQSYELEYGYGLYPSSWNLITSSNTPSANTLASLDTTQLMQGDVTIKLTVTNEDSETFEDRVTVFVAQPPPPDGIGPVPVMGFPSSDPFDGKFVTVVGKPWGTIPKPKITFYIQVPSGQETFFVDLFDGDMGTEGHGSGVYDGYGFGDRPRPEHVCNFTYTLYADKLMDGSTQYIIGQKTEYPENPADDFNTDYSFTHVVDGIEGSGSFSIHYCGQGDPECPTEESCQNYDCAKAPSGESYNYRIEAIMWNDVTGFNNPNENIGCINCFKVLTNSRIGIFYDEYFQIMAVDCCGDFVPGQFRGVNQCGIVRGLRTHIFDFGINTSFDSYFQFFFYVPSIPDLKSFFIEDCDADFLCDGYIDGDVDPPTLAVAQGENFMMRYFLTDAEQLFLKLSKSADGNTIWLGKFNKDLSGNYGPEYGHYDFETTQAHCWDWSWWPGEEKECVSGIYRWVFYNLFSENNIHIIPPYGSNFMLYPEPVTPLPISGARTSGFFEEMDGRDLMKLLPVILGRLDEDGKPIGPSEKICKVGQAKRIFSRADEEDPYYSKSFQNFLAQLLAVKLNLKSAEKRNEPLENARPIGHDRKVSEIVASADDLIASIEVERCMGKSGLCVIQPTEEQIEKIEIEARFLELINQGVVFFYQPGSSTYSSPQEKNPKKEVIDEDYPDL